MQEALAQHGYVAESTLATVLYLSLALERPLFLEGEAGVGKTEIAKVAAAILQRPLVRLQCYEGIDRETALYEWNYPKQLLHIRIVEAMHKAVETPSDSWQSTLEQELFTPAYLLRRPLLAAIDGDGPAPVLLIDEIDRSDEEFEAFLLELLAEFQISIPELGTIRASERPLVILTSNRTREVHDALKRRCLYHWIDYPDFAKEYRIVCQSVPGLSETLAAHICAFVQRLREEPLFKLPGLAETVHFAQALEALGTQKLDVARVEETIGCLLKYRDDFALLLHSKESHQPSIKRILADLGVLP